VGTVKDVSLSAKVIMLTEPVEGFSVIALTEESRLVSVDGSEITLHEIHPGMTIQATGQPGQSGALLATLVIVFGAEPTRIQFEPGTTSATVAGYVEERSVNRYVLRAFAGQTMEVIITSPNNDVLLTIVGADGIPLKRYVDGSAEWRGVLPSTQDYFIEAVSVGAATSYELTVWISPLGPSEPIRIQFAPGATSATIEGTLEPGDLDRYVLRAMRGQMMEVRVSPASAVAISVQGQDGSLWSVPPSEGTLRIERLPATQDYTITLAAVPSTGTTFYTMEVRIPPL